MRLQHAAGEQIQREQRSAPSHQCQSPASAGSHNNAAVKQLRVAVVQVASRLRRCEIGSGFNFSLFTILHTTTVKYKATEACQRRMGRAAISNWTVCHPVTAKVHKKAPEPRE